jgi:hypothetical protein
MRRYAITASTRRWSSSLALARAAADPTLVDQHRVHEQRGDQDGDHPAGPELARAGEDPGAEHDQRQQTARPRVGLERAPRTGRGAQRVADHAVDSDRGAEPEQDPARGSRA